MISLQALDIFLWWLFTRPKFSRKFIQRADVLRTVCFPACLLEICAKCVEGQCRIFFPRLLSMHEFFFCTSPPPPYNFSIGPSLKWMLSVYVGSTQTKASYQSLQTTISPSFSLRDSRANETRVRVKIIQREKGETRRGERQIRDYRQSPISHVFLSPQHLTFLAWGDFHAQSRFAPSTIPEGNKGCS